MQAPSSLSRSVSLIPASTHLKTHTATHSRCKLQEQTQVWVQMRDLTQPYLSTQTQIQFKSCPPLRIGLVTEECFIQSTLGQTVSLTFFSWGFWCMIELWFWQTHEKVLCLHIIRSITPPSCHRQDTDTDDQEHWDLLEEEWLLSFKNNKVTKCKTTICIHSKEQVRGLDSLCNHLNPQIKPSPAAARLLFWESDRVSVLCDLISHLHLYDNNNMFRAACGPEHHGFQLTKTQSQQSWLPSGTKNLLLLWSKWPLPPTMSIDGKVLQQTLLSCS